MDSVSLEKDLALDLINTKLRLLTEHANSILSTWGYDSSDDFLEDAKTGKIIEAENDAISLQHLYDQIEELQQLKQGIN